MILDEEQRAYFLSLLNRGDVKAYNSLYEKYYGLMVLYAYKLTGQKALAEDIVQDVFTSIWASHVQFADYRSIRTYLYHSVRNYCINHNIHPRSRQVALDEDGLADRLGCDPEMPFVEEEIYKLMFGAIDKLPKRCREVMLKSLEGKKNIEISKEMSLSADTIKTQKRRGLHALRRMLCGKS